MWSATGASRDDVRFVSERIGWLIFAARSGLCKSWLTFDVPPALLSCEGLLFEKASAEESK